jgi:hypothetical protein
MSLLQGALLTGAAATGLVVAERVRHRGSGEDVREDVTGLGTAVANQVGKAVGFAGHAGGKVLGKTSEFADGIGERTSEVVSGAGRTIARGAGAAMGAYAGMIDRVLPTFGRAEDAPPAAPKTSTPKTSTTKTSTTTTPAKKTTPAKRATTRARAS